MRHHAYHARSNLQLGFHCLFRHLDKPTHTRWVDSSRVGGRHRSCRSSCDLVRGSPLQAIPWPEPVAPPGCTTSTCRGATSKDAVTVLANMQDSSAVANRHYRKPGCRNQTHHPQRRIWAPAIGTYPRIDSRSHAIARSIASTKASIPSAGSSESPPHASTGSRRPILT
jgi:hypothetical protein